MNCNTKEGEPLIFKTVSFNRCSDGRLIDGRKSISIITTPLTFLNLCVPGIYSDTIIEVDKKFIYLFDKKIESLEHIRDNHSLTAEHEKIIKERLVLWADIIENEFKIKVDVNFKSYNHIDITINND